MEQMPRPWYKKKRYLIPLGLLAFCSLALADTGTQSTTPAVAEPVSTEASQVSAPAQQQQDAEIQPSIDTSDNSSDDSQTVDSSEGDSSDNSDADAAAVSNDSTYTNVDGNQIPSPLPLNDCASSGGSAICNDGSCSFSAHRSGTCSHHGGVQEWL